MYKVHPASNQGEAAVIHINMSITQDKGQCCLVEMHSMLSSAHLHQETSGGRGGD